MGTVTDVTDLRKALATRGYPVIPLDGKRPVFEGWQNKHGALQEEIESWRWIYPNALNTGVLTQGNPAIDSDITERRAADVVFKLIKSEFEERGEIIPRVGEPPKFAILLRTDEPFKKMTLKLTAPDGSPHKIEVLCDGQQIVIDGIHPGTKKPYQVIRENGGLETVDREDLPYVRAADCEAFLGKAAEALAAIGWKVGAITSESEPQPGGNGPAPWGTFETNILTGADFHDSIVKLAAQLISSGTNGGTVTNMLRSLMEQSTAPRDDRWHRALREIVPAVQSAERKFGAVQKESQPNAQFTPGAISFDDDTAPFTWDDPDFSLGDDRRGGLPGLPLEDVPSPIRPWLLAASDGAGTRPDHVMLPLLGVGSAIIALARRVEASPTFVQPFAMWVSVCGPSGTGKTPGFEVITRALTSVEDARSDKIQRLKLKHENEVERAKQARKLWQSQCAEAMKDNPPREMPSMPESACEIPPFQAPVISLQSVTVEAAVKLLQARPRGILIALDEIAGLFLNMCRYSGGSDREFYLSSWNGSTPYRCERVSRDGGYVKRVMIGITGGIQPDKVVAAFGRDDGGAMYARMLFGWPERAEYRPMPRDGFADDPFLINILARFNNLVAEDQEENFRPVNVPLSTGALDLFEAFRERVINQADMYDGADRDYWNKAQAHVLRLSGNLAFLDWAARANKPASIAEMNLEPTAIGEEFMRAAIDLWDRYFWPHARAVLRQLSLSKKRNDLRQILRWVQANSLTEISAEEIRQGALGKRCTGEEVQKALGELVRLGWLRRITTPRAPDVKTGIQRPGRQRVHWEVNPKIRAIGVGELGELAELEAEARALRRET
jgi:hypothetical protein